jgi:hypothetical protein
MRIRKISFHDARTALSACAAFAAVIFCDERRHFTIVPTHPSTWMIATQHRCGLLAIAMLMWFLCESTVNICMGIASPGFNRS